MYIFAQRCRDIGKHGPFIWTILLPLVLRIFVLSLVGSKEGGKREKITDRQTYGRRKGWLESSFQLSDHVKYNDMVNQLIDRMEDYLSTQHIIGQNGHQNMNKQMLLQPTNCYKCMVKFPCTL